MNLATALTQTLLVYGGGVLPEQVLHDGEGPDGLQPLARVLQPPEGLRLLPAPEEGEALLLKPGSLLLLIHSRGLCKQIEG